MKKHKITLIHSYDIQLDVDIQPSAYAPNQTMYILPNGQTPENYMRSIYQAEKEKAEWIRKYDNLLKGLNYWKAKANEEA